MIKLSFHALADFMAATPATQRKTLIDYKYPDEDEPSAKRLYYREARDAIRAYHVGVKESEWLVSESGRLSSLAALTQSKPSAIRLRSNSRVLESYAKHYDSNRIALDSPFKGTLVFGNVSISVNTDLRGRERGKEKIIRFDFSKNMPDPRYCSVAAQIMFEAANSSGINLPTSAFVVRHIESRTDFAPARKGARIMRDITATCENIEAIWVTL